MPLVLIGKDHAQERPAMPAILLLTLLCLPALAAPGPVEVRAQFVDEWCALGLPMYGQQSAALLDAGEDGDHKLREATFKLTGDKGAVIPLKVLLAESATSTDLMVDISGDGACSTDEALGVAHLDQRPPGFGPDSRPVWVAEIDRPFRRTVAFRLSSIPGMIVMAVRGYAAADLPGHRVFTKDANADLVLNAAADMLCADLNGDGVLTANGERMPVAATMDLADLILRPKLNSPMEAVTCQVEPGGELYARFVIAAVKTRPQKVLVSVQRRGGDTILLDRLGQPAKVRAGDHTVESLSLCLKNPSGPAMTYNFTRQGSTTVMALRPGGPSTFELVGPITLKPRWTLNSPDGKPLKQAQPGDTLAVELDAVTASGLALTGCNTGPPEQQYPSEAPKMLLLSPAGSVVFSGAMAYG